MKEKAFVGIVFTACLIVTMFAAISTKAAFVGTIKIGLIGPQGLPHWDHMVIGAEMAMEEINAAGGVHLSDGDYEIVLATGDSSGAFPPFDTALAYSEMIRLITVEGCEYIIGGFRTEVTGVLIETAMDYGVPFFICGSAPYEFLTETVPVNYPRYKYLFRVTPTNTTTLIPTIAGGLQYLIPTKLLPLYGQDLGGPVPQVRVAVVVEALEWTQAFLYYFANPAVYPAVLGPHANVTYVGQIPDGTLDCSPWLQGVIDSKARLMIHIFSGATGVPLIAQWKAMNVSALPVGINVMAQLQIHWSNTGGGCEYESVLNSVGTRTPLVPGVTEAFWDEFVTRSGGAWPVYTAFGAYSSVQIYAEGLEGVGSKDNDALVAFFEDPTWETLGPLGKFKFDSIHDVYCSETGPFWTEGYTRPHLVQWQAARMEIVSPFDQTYTKKWAIPSSMYPYRTDVSFDGKVDIVDIATAAKAFGSEPGHERWERVADVNDDSKVDIKDIATIAKDFGLEFSLPLP